MRVIIITSGISRILKPIYDNGFDVVGVLESMPRGWQPNSKSKFHRVLKGVYHSVFKRG
nr:methionyl-tRNA formyltransferase [Vibrio anguillarum]